MARNPTDQTVPAGTRMQTSADPSARARADELNESVGGTFTADLDNIIQRSTLSPTDTASESRRAAIALDAYLRAEQRGFSPGHALEDWLSAEREILEREGHTSIG